MRHEALQENLSAFLDGELTPGERAELDAHLPACAECRRELERLRVASAAFRAHAAVRAPEGLADAALEAERAPAAPPFARLRFALAALAIMLALMSAGTLLRPQFSAVLNQIQGMITGAASSIGDR